MADAHDSHALEPDLAANTERQFTVVNDEEKRLAHSPAEHDGADRSASAESAESASNDAAPFVVPRWARLDREVPRPSPCQALDLASRLDAAKESSRLEPRTLAQILNSPRRRWLVDGLLAAAALAMIYAQPKCGKTFIALDLARCIARGETWFGHGVQQGRVLMIVGEGHDGLPARLLAAGFGPEDEGLVIVERPIDLFGDATFKDEIIGLARCIGASLIIVDPLALCVSGYDENGTSDGRELARTLGAITRATGATILLVHHAGKDTDRGPRGNNALPAACDVVVRVVSRRGGRDRRLVVEMARDTEAGLELPFRLEDVDTSHGRSCRIVPHEQGSQPARDKPADIALRQVSAVINEMLSDDRVAREIVVDGFGKRRAIRRRQLNETLRQRGLLGDSNSKRPLSDNERRLVHNWTRALVAEGAIGADRTMVWRAEA